MFSDFLAPGGGWAGVGADRFRSSRRAEHWASACLNYLILVLNGRVENTADFPGGAEPGR